MKKLKCVRCEALDRRQISKEIHITEGGVPICSACLLEMEQENELFKEDEQGSEDPDIQDS